MTVTATFATGLPVSVSVDVWAVDAAVETFFEMGAITVSTREEV